MVVNEKKHLIVHIYEPFQQKHKNSDKVLNRVLELLT